MTRKTNRQKVIRADMDFVDRMNVLRGELMIRSKKKVSEADLTRKMVKCNAFNDLERELLSKPHGMTFRIDVKFDKKKRSKLL